MITDWDDAYANGAYIAGAGAYPQQWSAAALAFRTSMLARKRARLDIKYGPLERQMLDLFMPEANSCGLVMFVHGGYWKAFDKSVWSHLAAGAVASQWSVAIPSYTLAPQARLADIATEIETALACAASLAEGPIRLAGHSAGGQLVTRIACSNSGLLPKTRSRIAHVLSISGVHDLRPLLKTAMNETLRLDEAEAQTQSPALLEPAEGTSLTCWVGANERPEFLRQNDLLANIWLGLGAKTRFVHQADCHHFDVIADLEQPKSPIVAALTGTDRWCA